MAALPPSYKILVSIAEVAGASQLLELALGIARAAEGQALALSVVEVPEEENLSAGASRARSQRQALQRSLAELGPAFGEIVPIVRTAHHTVQAIRETAWEEGTKLILSAWPMSTSEPERQGHDLLRDLPCDIALFHAGRNTGFERILLPVRGGPHAALALQLAAAVARSFGGNVTLLRVDSSATPEPQRYRGRELFNELIASMQSFPKIKGKTVLAESVEEAIVQEAQEYDLVLLGAAARAASERDSLLGPLAERLLERLSTSVMIVKTRDPIDLTIFERPAQPIGLLVDKWFAENTFHTREFSHVDELVTLKERQGLTISLGLPALNEEATVGNVIRVLKGELMERKPLLDEIVLIDGGSTDRTRQVARELGIPVYRQDDILPQYGNFRGKGDALWKSLYVLKGDIIVWMDTDIKNIHPKFVYGVVGPLLRERRIRYAVGFSRRSLRLGSAVVETGGDRISELTARPLFNLFFPELSGLIEPASRGNAAYREVLERIPFATGYGVEIGNLIDVFTQFGLSAIAQTDLEERVHRENPLLTLSERASAVVQVVMRRLEACRHTKLLEDINTSMKLIHHEHDHYSLEIRDLIDIDRPPIITLPEYQESRSRGLPSPA